MFRKPTKRERAEAKRKVECLFKADIRSLYRLVRLNLRKGREPLALHKAKVLDASDTPQDGYVLSAVTTERVQRESFVGVVDDTTTVQDLVAMTGED